MRKPSIGLVPNVSGVGGMVSFRNKLAAGLEARGITTTGVLLDPEPDAVLVIGGTRQLGLLRVARRRGVRIVQRLDGINWLHRRRRTGLKHFLRSEIGNLLLRTIRSRIADAIVYQSTFSKTWWEQKYGPAGVPDRIVHNAVDLERYAPGGAHSRPGGHFSVLLVEGSLQGGYELGLESAIRLCTQLRSAHGLDVRLSVAGKVADPIRRKAEAAFADIDWLGLVPADRIPATDRSAHLLFSGDLNPACPNAVIEALACGLPVAAFDTGALCELVGEEAGEIVPFGGNPWKLDPPDFAALAAGAAKILADQTGYRAAARRRAEQFFELGKMIDGYRAALLETG